MNTINISGLLQRSKLEQRALFIQPNSYSEQFFYKTQTAPEQTIIESVVKLLLNFKMLFSHDSCFFFLVEGEEALFSSLQIFVDFRIEQEGSLWACFKGFSVFYPNIIKSQFSFLPLRALFV